MDELLYLKDLKHLDPKLWDVRGRNIRSGGRRGYLRIWAREVFIGVKQLMYGGTLHGVKYIIEPTFNRLERITWIFITVISIAFCSDNILQLFHKWQSSPFVNVMDSLPTPIWAVPFPTVVICPQLHVKLSYANVSELTGNEQFYASLVCPDMDKLKTANQLKPEENRDLLNFIMEAAPKCSEIVKSCYWRAINELEWVEKECCNRMFKPVFTDYGLCYAFNTLPLSGMTNETVTWQKTFDPKAKYRQTSWTLDDGYPKVFPPDLHMRPYRAMATGEMNGLGVELYLNQSEHQNACEGTSFGFNLLISSPTDHIYTSTVLRLPMDRLTTVEVTPQTYRTDVELNQIRPEIRQCFFQHERSLQYYALYTDSNCKMDLTIVQAKDTCSCLPYQWPRTEVGERICSTEADFDCIRNVYSKIDEQLIYAYFADSAGPRGRTAKEREASSSISCYPSCNDILYYSKVFYSDLIINDEEVKSGEWTRVDIHFFDDLFLGLHRHAQYDDYYFVGAIGGLLSLFMGFSLISVAELVYFILLRPLHRVLWRSIRERCV